MSGSMFVSGSRLVRPGCETEAARILATQRRTNVMAVLAGAVIFGVSLVLHYALLSPALTAIASGADSGSNFAWPAAAAFLLGLGGAWGIATVGDRRGRRGLAGITRDAAAYRENYGVMPTWLPADETWNALDHPGGVTSSPVHAKILGRVRPASSKD